MKPVMVRMPQELYAAIRVVAAKAGLSMAVWIRQVLREEIEEGKR